MALSAKTLSLRLDPTLVEKVDALAQEQGVSKSALVRRCIEEYVDRELNGPTAWELGKDLFGRYNSGRSDLSKNVEAIVEERIRAKHNRR